MESFEWGFLLAHKGENMHPAVGFVVGIVLTLVGLALFFAPQLQPGGDQLFWVKALVTIVAGFVPLLLIVLGIFLAWLQIGELKTKK